MSSQLNSTTTSFTRQTGIMFNKPTSVESTRGKILISSSQSEIDKVPETTTDIDFVTEDACTGITYTGSANESLQCHICMRKCKSKTGLKLHLKACKPTVEPPPKSQSAEESSSPQQSQQNANVSNENVFAKYLIDSSEIDIIYNTIVFWRRNIFNLPSGSAGKQFINESTRLMNAWSTNSSLRPIALKLLMIMPAVLLQKTSATSKGKDHTFALKRRMQLWQAGNMSELFFEASTIQKRLKSHVDSHSIESISKRFSALMQSGRVSAAVKLLSENAENGILPLTDETVTLLISKHPPGHKADESILLAGEIERVHPAIFDEISASHVQEAAARTKGGSGPSGMDADNWRHIIGSRKYGKASSDCREAIALMTRTICTEQIELCYQADDCVTSSLEALLSCRLVPLNKNPGCRPIGVGETLRRIISKVAMRMVSNDVLNCVGNTQVCAGQKGGSEAAIHAMRMIYEDRDTDAVLLVDASNAFNSPNRKAAIHNIGRLCPIMYTFVCNFYNSQARLFVIGGKEIRSCEGTTQGGPESMAIYALGTVPLLNTIIKSQPNKEAVKQVAYADDAIGGGSIEKLRLWWNSIVQYGPLFGYHANASKTWLVVKESKLDLARSQFEGTGVNITISGKRHLGAAIGTYEFKEEFISGLVTEWVQQIKTLADIARIDPHSAYVAFTHGLCHRYTYFMRTIPQISEMIQPLENAIRDHLIPALTEKHFCNVIERKLLSLPVRLGGLGIINPCEIADHEFNNSVKLTSTLTNAIIGQKTDPIQPDDKARREITKENKSFHEHRQKNVEESLSETQLRMHMINQQKGASSWLTVLPTIEHGFHLSKRIFWDYIRLRYGWPLSNLPSSCACGKPYNITHALSCHLGGFTTIRHNELRDLTAELLKHVCYDVQTEPLLEPLTGETFELRSTITAPEARLDVSARGLWEGHQKAFVDVRVVNPLAMRYQDQDPTRILESNAKEKKRQYCRRVLEIENGTFTPLIFTTNGGMGRECQVFYNRIALLLTFKWDMHQSKITSWVRARLSFALIRSTSMCIRGSRKGRSSPPVSMDEVESADM